MHIGPLYYYLLAPFFSLSHFDPIAIDYFNFLAHFINIALFYFVTRKLFGRKEAVLAIAIYALSHYLIGFDQTPWNVTLIPGIAAMIFYSLVQIVIREKYRWLFLLWTLSGLAFHFHFTAIFFPAINIISLLFVKDKKQYLKYSLLSLPLYLVWFIPNILLFINPQGDSHQVKDFLNSYLLHPHPKMFLYRLPVAFTMFDLILAFALGPLSFLKYFIPALFAGLIIFKEKKREEKILAGLMAIWFIIPYISFSIYSGPITDYYFVFQAPLVIYMMLYLVRKLFAVHKQYAIVALVILLLGYTYINTKDLWIKPTSGGYMKQRDEAWQRFKAGDIIPFQEGVIGSYLHAVWREDKSAFPEKVDK